MQSAELREMEAGGTDRFRFVDAPMSALHWAWLAPVLYLGALVLLKVHVAARKKPYDLGDYAVSHNLAISFVSAVLFAGMLASVRDRFGEEGWGALLDAGGRWAKGWPCFMLYINYLLKYVELADTVILVLRGKPTPFLHVYHHGITLVLCLAQLSGQTPLQWFVVTINLGVHVIMYMYYALAGMGYEPWWKRCLTVLQIVQFVAANVVCGSVFLLHFFGAIRIRNEEFAGTMIATWFGMAVLVSYLVLFLKFYKATYRPKPPPTAKISHSRAADLQNDETHNDETLLAPAPTDHTHTAPPAGSDSSNLHAFRHSWNHLD